MIIIFGSISMDMPLEIDSFSDSTGPVDANSIGLAPGGKAANQALAVARSGAKAALIGKTGNDDFSETILSKLRTEGIHTSGVGRSDLPTGISLSIKDSHGTKKEYRIAAANSESSANQIPDEILNDKSFVLLQTEITPEENADLLERAKAAGAVTMLNLSPSIDLSQRALDNLDYMVVNREEAKQLAEQLGITAEDEALKLAEGLSKQGNLTCIVTIGPQGSVAYTTEGIGWTVEALEVDDIVDRAGAEDSYCGTLAACLFAGMPLPRAMKRASIAASLTCTKKGAQPAFPFLDDIDKEINNLKDPAEV